MKRLLWTVALLLAPVAAQAHPGVGIVMDSRGNVYYTDLKQVWKLAPDGKKSVVVANVHTHELYLDADDNLYGEHLWYEGEAIDKWGHYVWRLGADGKLTRIIPPNEGFRKNYSFVRDRAGNMYWAEREARPIVIRKLAPDGKITDLAGDAGLSDVRWMTAAADGTVYFTDGPDLVRILPDGKTTRLARNLKEYAWPQSWLVRALQLVNRVSDDPHNLMGLWTDRRGNVYVAVAGARKVKRVSPEGRVDVVAESPLGWSLTGGLVAPSGDLWLLEYSLPAVRVRRISPDGKGLCSRAAALPSKQPSRTAPLRLVRNGLRPAASSAWRWRGRSNCGKAHTIGTAATVPRQLADGGRGGPGRACRSSVGIPCPAALCQTGTEPNLDRWCQNNLSW